MDCIKKDRREWITPLIDRRSVWCKLPTLVNDKLIIKKRCFLRMIVYLKKKCHFICMLQKSLYLCSCNKTRDNKYDYITHIRELGSPAYYSRPGRGTKRWERFVYVMIWKWYCRKPFSPSVERGFLIEKRDENETSVT